MQKAIFYDPDRKRLKRLRRLLDASAVLFSLVLIVFVFTALRGESLPALLLPHPLHPYHTLRETERPRPVVRPPRRKTTAPPSQVVLNTDEGIRAAFYVNWDAGSYSSLKEYVHQIDLLYPEWLHVLTPDGRLQGVSPENRQFDVLAGSKVLPVDEKVMPFLKSVKAETEVFPLVNNFDAIARQFLPSVGDFLNNPGSRERFRREIGVFLSSDAYRGICIDFEEIPRAAQPGFKALISELGSDLHARGMKLYVNVPASDDDYDYTYLAQQSDGLILMNYDQHQGPGKPGPVAAQDWFTKNLTRTLKQIPREKLICAVGSYGYDWRTPKGKTAAVAADVQTVSTQEAWLHAQESESNIEMDADSLNPHYAYSDENENRHDVWYLDAVTTLNQMRAARQMGLRTFALWRLGSEDRSMWAIWDSPSNAQSPSKLAIMPSGQDVDTEGKGEILVIERRPTPGVRSVKLDAGTGMITAETITSFPTPYELHQFGDRPKQIALTFDDGPDPTYTPKILEVLRAKNVKATFFMIGSSARDFSSLTNQVYDEGHEIGNHTFTHPDISNLSRTYMEVELNLTERLFAAKLGIKPLYFRPPYSIDQEPDTADEVKPLEVVQQMGYITVGAKIDPNDWKDNPHTPAEEITAHIIEQLPLGNIVLLHDGGGDRSETVKALPMIIDQLRARGYELAPVSALLGKQRADVMPAISANERLGAQVDDVAFWLWDLSGAGIELVFFIGDALMMARLIFIGILAIYDRLRKRDPRLGLPFSAPVAVLIPAYNEEQGIERTIRSVLASDYPNFRIIMVDDGSTDSTLEVTHRLFAAEMASGRLLVISQPNAGKAEALNHGLTHVTEDFFVGIDADTEIASNAISLLLPHFAIPRVAAVAGNTKVGNRVNLWTRWQALEYLTSQNFERRALNTFGAVTVVPGAIGAWRVAAVREAGGYPLHTVAEDADLTMSLLQMGAHVVYEDSAIAYTEAPISANGLIRQRFRWSFGILQSVWKHRGAFGHRGTLGWVALPNILVFQILLPLVSPFIDLMFIFGTVKYLLERYFHPETSNPTDFVRLLVFFLAFLVIDFLASTIAVLLERRTTSSRSDIWLLAHIWLQRFTYRQLFSVVLFKTLKRAFDGRAFAWDKLERMATDPHAEF